MGDLLEKAKRAIPADVRMYSGCRDEQTSADVSNVTSFSLPDPQGRAGGACTATMLQILYADEKKLEEDLTFQEVLLKMRDVLKEKGFSQIPQLSASRPIDIKEKFDLVPDNIAGTKRAVMIGINYVGDNPGELRGCHNDVFNMKKYIQDVHGFEDENITILMDDGNHTVPTRENILAAYSKIVEESQPGDAVFCHYSGHGGKLKDDNGDEADGYDETLVPVDYKTAGQIRDDLLYKNLVGGFKEGVFCTFVMDCCHSGSVLDLPFQFQADGESDSMEAPADFDFGPLLSLAASLAGGQNIGTDPGKLLAMCGSCIVS
mmetsp:Transcript_4038/g.5802  ORF Transcript_4038/g.5802 Transcript_4038/m.5802 type:complete len:318 (-) Transcript_4038:207-1160(-)|eukprot:CAMPEP_0194210966 /NCGR_PEP_ID=MMETSP0156-20130528/9211_1 /TAXON_ID=33649 /ORGANISM="Thalassionema nitzschioides, Strain L26-B" /LENGTH=317 /DNA_ID=CAMNT_0038938385 /DNA_START=14 /DNA_END=967 /DNA_ORIENTATION=-